MIRRNENKQCLELVIDGKVLGECGYGLPSEVVSDWIVRAMVTPRQVTF